MLYENIAELAKKKGMSLSEVERKSGLSKGVISKWRNADPNVGSLIAVADTLGVTLNHLVR